MRLSELFINENVNWKNDLEISGIATHSSKVQQGNIFFALKGSKGNGSDHIKEAISNGAVVIISNQSLNLSEDIKFIVDENPRKFLSVLASRFYKNKPDKIIAVTGTNGKTSVAWFVREIWRELGINSASIGTLGLLTDIGSNSLNNTTPEPIELFQSLSKIAEEGASHVVVEASSHGLHQHRLDGVKISTAGFTNLTRDHLDYHGTIESYFSSKMRLFNQVMQPKGNVVLNADSHYYPEIVNICKDFGHRIISYGKHGGTLRINDVQANSISQNIHLEANGNLREIRLPIVGDFQAWNALCALGMVIGAGADIEDSIEALTKIHTVPGRIQLVAELNGGKIFVDYAHTPDALRSCLSALRQHKHNHLTVVFGCGGDRDRGKRSEMGSIASSLADRVIVTDDNPRSENSASIRKEVMNGCSNAFEVGDRAEAIEFGLSGMGEGDILLIAGKGHEASQIVGSSVLDFDDSIVVRNIVKELSKVEV